MSGTTFFIIRFYVPLLIACALMLIVIFTPKVRSHGKAEFEVKLWVLGLVVPLGVWLKHVWIVRSIVVLSALGLIATSVGADFSEFFPTKLKMDVYFDLPGIRRTLRTLSNDEVYGLGLNPDWERYVERYDQEVLRSLNDLWKQNPRRVAPEVLAGGRATIHGSGDTTFVAERDGLFAYRITDSQGLLDFSVEAPRVTPGHFRTSFALLDTASNHIGLSIGQLMRNPSVVIEPEFKQVLSIEDGAVNAPFDHVVVGATKLWILPLPQFGNTLYLWKLPDGTKAPVGYAVYF